MEMGREWKDCTMSSRSVHDQIPVLSGYPSERAEQKEGREEEDGSQARD